ncbi:MAG: hypothetical protein MR908_08420 [Firmicutes bacterium]|nr:hypothetical protein [Bacillota bacterium]
MKRLLIIIMVCIMSINIMACGATKDYEDINIVLNEEATNFVSELYNNNGVHIFKIRLVYNEVNEGTNVEFDSMIAVTETEEGKYEDPEVLSITTNPPEKHDYYGLKIFFAENEDAIQIFIEHNGSSGGVELLEIVDESEGNFVKYGIKRIERVES